MATWWSDSISIPRLLGNHNRGGDLPHDVLGAALPDSDLRCARAVFAGHRHVIADHGGHSLRGWRRLGGPEDAVRAVLDHLVHAHGLLYGFAHRQTRLAGLGENHGIG